MFYLRVCKGLATKGTLVPIDSAYDEPRANKNTDWYESVYFYNEAQKQLFYSKNEKGDIQGVSGITDVVTNRIIFDFDSKTDIELAKKDTEELLKRLDSYKIDTDLVQIYFSGQKGFTVVVEIDDEGKNFITPKEASHCALNVLGKGLKTLDPSCYNANRILRIPGTRHPGSGLYKVPLSRGLLAKSTVADIKALATDVNNVTESFWWNTVKLTPELRKKFFHIPEKEKPAAKPEIASDLQTELDIKPSNWKDYKWAIFQGFFEPGERHNALMVIASTCKGLGYDKETTYQMCKAALKKQARRSQCDEFSKVELWENICGYVFSEKWKGGQYNYKNNPWLQAYVEKMGFSEEDADDEDVMQISDIKTGFKDFVKHIEENTIKSGIRELDEVLPMTIGLNLLIIGAPGAGKTSVALDILKNTSKSGVTSVFASLDMHRNRLYEKLLYKVSGLPRKELYEKIQNDQDADLVKAVEKDYGNVWFYDRSCPTVSDLREYILDVERKTGNKVKLVMLDYFERVNSEKSDDTAASKDVAGALQDLVNDLDICLVTLVQPNKFSLNGGPNTPIKSYTAIKGSSFMYQSARGIVSLWRPFYTPDLKQHDKYIQMAVLKNDLGEIGQFELGWNGKRGDIFELTDEEREEFHNLMEEKERSEKNEGKGEWA